MTNEVKQRASSSALIAQPSSLPTSPRTRSGFGRGKRRALTLLLGALLAWPLVAWGAAAALVERRVLERADVLVVLSGSSVYQERARWAARLFREGRAPRVVLTRDEHAGGWSQERGRTMLFYERAVEELERAGVPPERIEVLPGPVTSTYEEAVALRDYAAKSGARRLLVVTSAYHTRRARWTFDRVLRGGGVEVGIDAPPIGQQSPAPLTWWLRPRGWSTVAMEYPKMIYYRLSYR